MDVAEAVVERRSIRAYEPEPVPLSVLREIMEQALRAPSWGNTQPWRLTVVSGEALRRIQEEYVADMMKGREASPDHDMPTQFDGAQKARYQGLGRDLFAAFGIGREDKQKRAQYGMDMMRCFGAPHVIYLHLDKGFHAYALMDGGIILQTIALLAVEKGLGTCFLAQSVRYPDVVRKHAGIPDDQALVMGLSIGLPVKDHPRSLFRSGRGEPEEFLRFVE
jgi:nitroreductase